ncbi:hypothetical protein [Bradyrhizobium daqingense]|uniref:Uncharacterized protein n=1 Tax=Bradyrhizobium daqingense TaxID=993502 RepID=A0A562LMR4_9BRAD|nr:hypothetical protein [Bradyrhizobium daqingense]TWI08912.1 hypothetical protein IQ17_01737 [Bradyrhizobium daqingense]
MAIFTALAGAALATVGITGTLCGEAEILETAEEAETEGDDE